VRARVALTRLRGSLGTRYALGGQIDEMDRSFESARLLWEGLARRHPHNPEYRDWLATAAYWHARAAVAKRGHDRKWTRLLLTADGLWQELAHDQPEDPALLEKAAATRLELLCLRDPGPHYKEVLQTLEEERKGLDERARQHPHDAVLRKRLALICLTLGESHLGTRSPDAARTYWQEAHGHFSQALRGRSPRPPDLLSLALCCCRLMDDRSVDRRHDEAISLLQQAIECLSVLKQRHPDTPCLRMSLLEAHCTQAVCHWKAGRADLARRAFRERIHPLAEQASLHPSDYGRWFNPFYFLLRAAGSLQDANHPAAREVALQAAALAEQCADSPTPDFDFCAELANDLLGIAGLLCRLGEPARSLQLAERGRHLFAGLHRAVPEATEYGRGLSQAWERVAKARWALGLAQEALAAFAESTAVQRQVVARAPSARSEREHLSRCYDRQAHWSRLGGDRGAASAALLEREKLWPGDPGRLMDVSRDFQGLAAAVGHGDESLTPEQQAERQRYLAESQRLWQAAEAARDAQSRR
jgi:hypothetical protein